MIVMYMIKVIRCSFSFSFQFFTRLAAVFTKAANVSNYFLSFICFFQKFLNLYKSLHYLMPIHRKTLLSTYF